VAGAAVFSRQRRSFLHHAQTLNGRRRQLDELEVHGGVRKNCTFSSVCGPGIDSRNSTRRIAHSLAWHEAAEDVGFIRCLDHGYPTLSRAGTITTEYELAPHRRDLRKAFVGDWIGQFQPGHLVLAGPGDCLTTGSSLDCRTAVTTARPGDPFHHAPIRASLQERTELAEVLPLLNELATASNSLAFRIAARIYFESIKSSRGLERFAAFCQFMAALSHCSEYQLLSSVRLQGFDDDISLEQINSIVNQLTDNIAQAPSMREFAAQFAMTESRFSRFPASDRKQFHRFSSIGVRHQQGLLFADGLEPLHHAHLLRRRLQQCRQLQSTLSGNKGHDAKRVPASCQPPIRRLSRIRACTSASTSAPRGQRLLLLDAGHHVGSRHRGIVA